MSFVQKRVAAWEIKHGQIALTGKLYKETKALFSEYLNKNFDLITFHGSYENKNFIEEVKNKKIRLGCMPFFRKLKSDQIIYLQPLNKKTIGVFDKRPT